MDIGYIDKSYYYNGNDLGISFFGDDCIFKLWSPVSNIAYVCIYNKYNSNEAEIHAMEKDDKGVFSLKLSIESCMDKYYRFRAEIGDAINEFADPYAIAASVNGDFSAIIDIEKTNPVGFKEEEFKSLENNTDAIIYEVSVRDISIAVSSNIKNKGKFLGLTELQDVEFIDKTGLSYIKELGVTHIQLMPVYDFESIDETLASNCEEVDNRPYNWGYDPQNYNVLEGSYATDPYNPYTRIKEFKTAVKAIHDQGLGVIMDVVYNHMYEYENSGFHKSMPGYFFRYRDGKINDETGCGNVFASEHRMARKFIVDSVKFWAKEYKLDGFRFDLMGLIDIDTMLLVRDELRKINPDIIIIGEGWNMGNTLPEHKKAIQKNASYMEGIGFFNDSMRDSLRGSGFIQGDRGYLIGNYGKKEMLKKSIVGGVDYSYDMNIWGDAKAGQVVNYVECHDNHTLFDKLVTDGVATELIEPLHKLGNSIIMLSQGIPFLHLGQEFLRTKNCVENSYNKPDSINKVDWNRKKDKIEDVNYLRGLIKLRKSSKLFRMIKTKDIREKLIFINTDSSAIAYVLNGDEEKILVVHNANKQSTRVTLCDLFNFEVLVNKDIAGDRIIEKFKSNFVEVDGLSTFVARIYE